MSPAAKSKNSLSPLVDVYIGKAAPFAQPILWHLRGLMHKAAPGAEEVMKWSMPFFTYKGIILGNMAAFKKHCSFGLWGEEIAAKLRADGVATSGAMGSFGQIESVKDLPDDKKLLSYIKQSVAVIDSGTRTKSYSRPPRAAKPELETPVDLTEALKKNRAAQKAFEAFAPSHRREYIEWITEAKRDETRARRVTQTVDWLAEGKRRNWKYEEC